jgi:hypothetical protein
VDEHLLSGVEIVADALTEADPVTVEVTLNGQQFGVSTASYSYRAPARVSAFSPTSGPVGGDTSVVVYGAFFEGGLSYACRFGNATVSATVLMDTALACVSPSNGRGTMPLEVSLDSYNFTTDGVPFSYYPEPGVQSLAPVGGPRTAGNTLVLLSGARFSAGSDYRCKFGDQVVRAVVAGEANLTCASPSQLAASDVVVEVTMNGQQYSRSGVVFAYHTPEQVIGVSPSSGMHTGSTYVRVLGTGFQPFSGALCRFGDTNASVHATYVSSEEMRCASVPARSSGASVSVWLDFEGADELEGLATLHTAGPRGALVVGGELSLTSEQTKQISAQVTHEHLMADPRQLYVAASFDLYIGGGTGGGGRPRSRRGTFCKCRAEPGRSRAA